MNKLNFAFCLALLSLPLYGEVEEDCDSTGGPPKVAHELIQNVNKITQKLYKDVFELKVNMDGDGKLSVFFENGEPKILKLTYKNKSGTTVEQITFDDLAKGKVLSYENSDVPGKAISVEKGSQFKVGNAYKFKLSYRTGVKPPQYASQNIDFNANASAPSVSVNNQKFGKMILSPGVSFLSWDGTFKKVEFK